MLERENLVPFSEYMFFLVHHMRKAAEYLPAPLIGSHLFQNEPQHCVSKLHPLHRLSLLYHLAQ